MKTWYRWCDDNLELSLRVQPRAAHNTLVGPDLTGEYLCVRLQTPPIAGKANEALRRLFAAACGVAPSQVKILRGERARYKILRIQRARNLPSF